MDKKTLTLIKVKTRAFCKQQSILDMKFGQNLLRGSAIMCQQPKTKPATLANHLSVTLKI
jgi:hypothetical protein